MSLPFFSTPSNPGDPAEVTASAPTASTSGSASGPSTSVSTKAFENADVGSMNPAINRSVEVGGRYGKKAESRVSFGPLKWTPGISRSANEALGTSTGFSGTSGGATGRSILSNFTKPFTTVKACSYLYIRSVWFLVPLFEIFVTPNNSFFWTRSLVWSHDDGSILKSHMSARYGNSALLATLLLSAQVTALFSPSQLMNDVRSATSAGEPPIHFAIGFLLIISIFLTLATIIAMFTAYAMVGAISDGNIHAIVRSGIGLYATQLPTTLLTLSLYTFIAWMIVSSESGRRGFFFHFFLRSPERY